MTVHDLKLIQPYFNDVQRGYKTFEVRRNDRNFQIGDILNLQEYDPVSDTYSGSYGIFWVTYVLSDEQYVKEGFVILGIKRV
jgi:hypothetical protein